MHFEELEIPLYGGAVGIDAYPLQYGRIAKVLLERNDDMLSATKYRGNRRRIRPHRAV